MFIRRLVPVAAVVLAGFFAHGAEMPRYTGEVFPRPQQILSDWRTIELKDTAFRVNLADPDTRAQALAKELLDRRFAEAMAEPHANPQARPVVVTLGAFEDAAVRAANRDLDLGFDDVVLPTKGYALRVRDGADGTVHVVAAGQGVRGTWNAAMTVVQQMGVDNGRAVLRLADINDWPHWQRPYAMEYGPATADQLEGLAYYKVDGFAIQHRFEWREFRPDHKHGRRTYDELLSEMAGFREKTGLFDFMLLLHIYAAPDEKAEPLDITNPDHVEELVNRCRYAAGKGIGHVMILADDWTPQEEGRYVCMHKAERERFGDSVGRAHGYLMARLHEALKREYPSLELSFCPAPYSLAHVYGRTDKPYPHMVQYLRDLDAAMPRDIPVVWTGPAVCSATIERGDFLEYSRYVGDRPSFLWDNSNGVTAVRSMPRFGTARYGGFAADSHGLFYLNAFAFYWPWHRPFVLSAMDALWKPEGFDTDASYEQAIGKMYGPGVYPAVDAYYQARKAMKGLESSPEALREKMAVAEPLLKQLDDLGLPTTRLRRDLDSMKGYTEIDLPEAAVPRFDTPPVIDGRLDDACWKTATALSDFVGYPKPGDRFPTSVRIGYDNENFYVAFHCEWEAELPNPPHQGRHDASVFDGADAFGMMIQPQGGAYAHLAMDHANNRFDECRPGGPAWDCAWKSAVVRSDKEWTAEVVVPFAELRGLPMDAIPAPGETWRVNFMRYYAVKGELSTWSDTHGNRFHNPPFFGVLRFE